MQVSGIIRIFADGAGRIRSAEGALCTNLANGNVGNFHSNVQEGTTASTLMRGAVTHFHIKVFLRPPFGTGKAVPRFCYVVTTTK